VNEARSSPVPLTLVVLPGEDARATLESVREQAAPPLEVFLPDPPAAALGAVPLRRLPGGGTAAALGAVLAEVRGAWLQVVDAGTRLRPRACRAAMDQVLARPHVGVFLADSALAAPDGERTLPALDWQAAAGTFTGMELAELRSHGPGWPQDAMVLSTARLRAAGGFPPELEWHVLWWATHLLAFRHGATYLRQVLTVAPDRERGDPGARVWSLEYPVLRALLRRLADPAQADLLAPLALGGALGAFGHDLAEVYLSEPELWREGLSLALGPCLEAHRNRKPRYLGQEGRTQADRDRDMRVAAELRAVIAAAANIGGGGGGEAP
jgi:hypothetical protein